MNTETFADWAVATAEEQLKLQLPTRWLHLSAAIETARRLADITPDDADLLVAAVALHDIGFAPVAKRYATGFSTLDGVLYLKEIGAPSRLIDLVAHQSVGPVEAELRGLSARWAQEVGPDEGGPVRDALWTSCLTTAPDGKPTTVAERCAGWIVHYPLGWVPKYLERCTEELTGAVARTEARLAYVTGGAQ